jgi:hypothetical protein
MDYCWIVDGFSGFAIRRLPANECRMTAWRTIIGISGPASA